MKKSSILLVDDDQELRQAMRAWLAPLFPEWTFEETNCAEAALGDVALHLPALVLMDFKVPRINGIEATRRMKVNAPQLPVVIVTVYEDAAYQADALAAGAAGYVCKRQMHANLVPLMRELLPSPTADKNRLRAESESSNCPA